MDYLWGETHMAANEYHFITHWRMEDTTVQEVTEILSDAVGFVRWWPSVYLDITVLELGDAAGIGKVVKVYSKGWLPYTLRWQFHVSDVSEAGFGLNAEGDFVGRGEWGFKQDGNATILTYDWRIHVDKPLLKALSFMMKPIFSANHHWAMAKGEESLRLELLRRRAKTPEERAAVPPPPPPTWGRFG